MLDMGWTEILLIGVIALIVVGPKDLPRMMRTFGQFVGKMRGMAREFQRSMNDAANEADLAEFKDIKDTLNEVKSVQNNASSAIRKGFDEIDKDIEKSTDLKTDDTPEAPASANVSSDTEEKPTSNMTSTASPIDKPDPSKMANLGPAPGDLVDEPEVPTAAAPEARTASNA